MPTYKRRPPFRPLPPRGILRVWTPSTIGALTAAALTAYPRCLESVLKHLVFLEELFPWAVGVFKNAPFRAYTVVFGFAIGYGASKTINLLRWKALRHLFAYQTWMTNPKAFTNKLWMLALKLCLPAPPHSTFQFQSLLPHQPLPTLQETLDLYLQVSKQLLTKEEFLATTKLVEEFRNNEGPKLQQHLVHRAKTTTNWLADYWMNAAYLTSREPLPITNNYYQSNHIGPHRTTDPLARAACLVNIYMDYIHLVQSERLLPVMVQDMVPLCMEGYRYIFNTCRIPGEEIDTIVNHPGKFHIVVIRKGHFFILDLIQPDSNGVKRRLTTEEIKIQFQAICRKAENREAVPPVASLTAQNRTTWAKQRRHLAEQNQAALEAVESAMFVMCLDHRTPKDVSERSRLLMTGTGENRWFDKSVTVTVFADVSEGANVEHSALDAMIMSTVAEYQMCYEEYENGDVVKDPRRPPRNLPEPKEIEWKLDGMHDMIKEAALFHQKRTDDIEVMVLEAPYSKGFMKKCRLSPDGYVQMALMLAWYREYKDFTKTYEPSTGRFYILGRTETVHPGSRFSFRWVKAMVDQSEDKKELIDLLKKAIKAQTEFRLRATVGRGCDRHLLGLYCAARELGIDVPAIFRDKAWTMPFRLSTSNTPTAVVEYGPDVLFSKGSGGFGPSCHDGYGISYIFCRDDLLTLQLSCWRSCQDTSCARFAAAIFNAMDEMKKLLS